MNRFVQTLCIVGAVGVAVLVTSTFGQLIGLPPLGDSICYETCDLVPCNHTSLQGGSCGCVGSPESTCGGSTAWQFRGEDTGDTTANAYGQQGMNFYLAVDNPGDCGKRAQRMANCMWDDDGNTCFCDSSAPWTFVTQRYRQLKCEDCEPLG